MKLLRAAVVAAFAVFVLFSVDLKREIQGSTAARRTRLTIGSPAPPIQLSDMSGRQVDLTAVCAANKVVMVNFWASWCPPCRLEMPQFEKMYAEKKGLGIEILAVSVDKDPEALKKYLDRKPVSFPILRDAAGITADRYGVNSFPTTIFVSAQGEVLEVLEGMQTHIEFQADRWLKEAGNPR